MCDNEGCEVCCEICCEICCEYHIEALITTF